MLYLDSSALVKLYFKEPGSDSLLFRIKAASQAITASVLSFTEVHAAIARKRREMDISSAGFFRLRDQFETDWSKRIEVIELNGLTMAALPRLVEQFPLKAGDAVQLSTALWLYGEMKRELGRERDGILEFVASDRTLAHSARKCGLQVFNPEEKN
jgi:uncharacterized protein